MSRVTIDRAGLTRRLARARAVSVAALSITLLALMALAGEALATPAKVGPPTSIDALGDSISRGYDSQGSGCTALSDCPAFSWETGTSATVDSIYLRTKALNPSVLLARPIINSTTGGNDAKTGAKMSELPEQAKNAVNAPNTPDQVLILMGANDVCTSSEATMTPVSSFRASFKSGLEILSSGLPEARIDVASIPNIFNLWSVLHSNLSAQLVWGLAKICQAMLVNPTSTSPAEVTRRANVQKRNIEFNTVLGEVCAQFIHCHYDGGAAYAINFPASDVGTIDYFHPNEHGQALAAATEWEAGPKYTDLTTPTTTISTDRPPDGVEGWYRHSVTVSLSASDSEYAVAGTEYKIGEAPSWTRYTAPITISGEGQTTITARSVDVNGNIEASKSDVIKIDETKPTFTLSCPTGPVLLNSEASYTISQASDTGSGFAASPEGTFPITTSTAGTFTVPVEVSDRAGNTATQQCHVDVVYPVPGVPALSSGSSPNTGVFGLSWTPSADPLLFGSLQYTLQHRNADSEWSDVSTTLGAPSFEFTAGTPESEGTWRYRVLAHEGEAETAYSEPSEPIVVDRTPPNAPTITPDRAPDYAGGGGWYRDSVTLTSTDNGDPALADGSPGSGVDPASVPAPVTYSSSGSFTDTATVKDRAGNTSSPTSLTVQVDATPPSLSVSCPSTALLNASASATVTASDGQSGLAVDPSGTVPIDTSSVGEKTITETAVDNVGHVTTEHCTTDVVYPVPGVPALSSGSTPNTGVFGLSWTPSADPLLFGSLQYTLQHRDADSEWSDVSTALGEPSFEFTAGTPESEGTWRYRVLAHEGETETAYSEPSEPVVVDNTPPAAPTASADRAPDYAGGGGWYKDSVTVSFAANGDPVLADGSPGSGVNPASIPSAQTFDSDGSHTACATMSDNAGNQSAAGCLTVQVDATPPSVQITCPASVLIGSPGVTATVTASDGQSGLASDPSGTVAIETSIAGAKTVTRTAVDNVGHSTTSSCTTQVVYSEVITGTVKRTLYVKAGQAVELAPGARVKAVVVEAGGSLDAEGATITNALRSSGASLIRICGASVGTLSVLSGSGSVVIGEGDLGCAANTFSRSLLLEGNTAGVTVKGNTVAGSVDVKGNAGGATVTGNTIAKRLSVTGNSGTVIDRPNTVAGKSKLQ